MTALWWLAAAWALGCTALCLLVALAALADDGPAPTARLLCACPTCTPEEDRT